MGGRWIIFGITKKINQKRAEGVDVITFAIGDPDIPTPDTVIESLTKASLNNINHRYPESEGLPEFRLGIANWYSKRFLRIYPLYSMYLLVSLLTSYYLVYIFLCLHYFHL